MAGQQNQAAHASADPYTSYLEALDDEYWDLLQQGDPRQNSPREVYAAARKGDAAEPERTQAEAAFRADLIARLHTAKRSALCFSGGGIRSATFGLGILQGLAARSSDPPEAARPSLLGEFDYLSTVSGGGYVGAWFSAWATRIARAPAERIHGCSIPDRRDGPAEVIRLLAKNPQTGFDPEREAVRHLRAFSNYLMPRSGLLSGDTWAGVATVLRNIFLNWLVLIPLVAVVLLIPIAARDTVLATNVHDSTRWFLLVSGFVFGAFATGYIGFDLPSAGNARKRYVWYVGCCLIPLVLAAINLNTFWALVQGGRQHAAWWDFVGLGKEHLSAVHFALLGAAMHGGGMLAGIVWAMFRFKRPAPKIGLIATAAAVGTGFVAGLVAYGTSRPAMTTGLWDQSEANKYTALAFPIVMAVFMLAATLLVGLTSYVTRDQDREWWARSGGVLLGVSFGWAVFAGVVLYAPQAVDWLTARIPTDPTAALGAVTGCIGWMAAHLGSSAGTPAGRRKDEPSGTPRTAASSLKTWGAALLSPAFVLLLAMLITMLNIRLKSVLLPFIPSTHGNWPLADAAMPALCLAAAYGIVCLAASLFINVNKFSLHSMYRERLIRAYLGASNENRSPHWFTGFDENDNLPMCALTAHKPLHVVNMALNLVGGTNLAWQQRKAESFTSTRLHTGSCRVGYRSSKEYGGRYGQNEEKTPISLGTAITISGAAASPNMGYNSSPLLTLIMALFNARLGWWLGNPREHGKTWTLPGPRFGIRSFIDEALGLTNDTNAWIYLSDGGHFENLGLYEMVLRRCRYIVVSDAGADPAYAYEDLGNAIRKVRVDMGISIEFDKPPQMSAKHRPTSRFSGHHCATARIRYSDVDGEVEDGVLVYIKPSLTGDELLDIQHYASRDPLFPHQPTADQFFDEAQFESYRRLGLHIVEKICCCSNTPADKLTLSNFITAAQTYATCRTP